MKTKKYKWVGVSKVIPLYGVATPGKTIKLPVDIGDDFVKQELAVEYKAKAKKTLTNEVK